MKSRSERLSGCKNCANVPVGNKRGDPYYADVNGSTELKRLMPLWTRPSRVLPIPPLTQHFFVRKHAFEESPGSV